jgi:ABC-type glycerol-3-phosphate transport system permease component
MITPLDRIPESVFRVLSFIVIGILLILIIFPVYFMTTTAFKIEREIYSELTWIPNEPTLANFNDAIYNFRIPV